MANYDLTNCRWLPIGSRTIAPLENCSLDNCPLDNCPLDDCPRAIAPENNCPPRKIAPEENFPLTILYCPYSSKFPPKSITGELRKTVHCL